SQRSKEASSSPPAFRRTKSPVAGSLPKQPTCGGAAEICFLRQNIETLSAAYARRDAQVTPRVVSPSSRPQEPFPTLSPMLAGQFVARKKLIGKGWLPRVGRTSIVTVTGGAVSCQVTVKTSSLSF